MGALNEYLYNMLTFQIKHFKLKSDGQPYLHYSNIKSDQDQLGSYHEILIKIYMFKKLNINKKVLMSDMKSYCYFYDMPHDSISIIMLITLSCYNNSMNKILKQNIRLTEKANSRIAILL